MYSFLKYPKCHFPTACVLYPISLKYCKSINIELDKISSKILVQTKVTITCIYVSHCEHKNEKKWRDRYVKQSG